MAWYWPWAQKYWYWFTVWSPGADLQLHQVFSDGPRNLTEEEANDQSVDYIERFQAQADNVSVLAVWRWSPDQHLWFRIT